jgi:hypothetical protein
MTIYADQIGAAVLAAVENSNRAKTALCSAEAAFPQAEDDPQAEEHLAVCRNIVHATDAALPLARVAAKLEADYEQSGVKSEEKYNQVKAALKAALDAAVPRWVVDFAQKG